MLKTISSVATQIISSITGGLIKFTGPASGQTRTITVPDANFTVARTDAAQTFTGDQTFNGGLTQRGSNPVPFVLLSSTIPFVMVSSGTMGNNGALSGLTAVAFAYPRAYVYLPSGAISAGSAAGWYYAVFSYTTAATVYNNTYTTGTPTVPASPTAFVTTGPGAYTQTTGTSPSFYGPNTTLPANVVGKYGTADLFIVTANNNSAGSKGYFVGTIGVGGSNTFAQTTATLNATTFAMRATGATNSQYFYLPTIPIQGASSINTAIDNLFGASLFIQTATDTMTCLEFRIVIYPKE